MLTTVIETVEDIASRIPAATTTTATTLPGLLARFTDLDRPLTAELRDRLPAGDWVIDSIDGAVQYLQGLPQWCVTATLVDNGEAVLTVLHSPTLGETYAAERGKGAWRDGKPIRPSAKVSLAAALAGSSHPATPQPGANAAAGLALPGMLDRVAALRNLGPTSWQVAEVGAGRVDLFWVFGRDAENLLGAGLVATEAGAVVSSVDGSPWTPEAPGFLVAAPGLHAAAVAALAGRDLPRSR
ncbi:inositol monophosphatase family protein [Actinokineospora cianjurensis]|uniref:Myo-inositol-1(Or 4)-monophosphatase n=1 Tax=Actinokineospora cianjurensis TaxID=585224 RepID=A0A421B1Q6_9PSEU|nr:inositol monophosphatase family protein [Actinokineospora cianjurensis]RLK58287.1 myo-inositol-1(or 4)-monophosphatase [Actinokineospora cianjurensis]